MTEPKYIDADKLLTQAWNNLYKCEDIWEKHCGPDFIIHGRPEMQAGFESAHKAIVDAPPADVVEVVRCKDCKNSSHWYGDRFGCSLWTDNGVVVFEDGYCSYGERKDG